MLTLISNFNCIWMRLSHSSFYLFRHYIFVASGYFSWFYVKLLGMFLCYSTHTHTSAVSRHFWCLQRGVYPSSYLAFSIIFCLAFILRPSFLIRFVFAWNITFSSLMLLVSPVLYLFTLFHFNFFINFAGIG